MNIPHRGALDDVYHFHNVSEVCPSLSNIDIYCLPASMGHPSYQSHDDESYLPCLPLDIVLPTCNASMTQLQLLVIDIL